MKAYQQIPRRPIVTLFRDIPPSALFHLGQEFSHASHSHSRINFDIVARCLLTSWPTKSEDEIEHALKYLKSLMTGTAKPETVFYLTNLIGKTYLDFEDGQFHVATEHLLRWREISLQLDADLFTTSTLAWESTKAGKNLYQGNYGWPHVLLPENRKSRVLHDYGIVENHSHLNAIGNVFLPTWISLMNRVIGREGEFEKAGISKRHLGYDIHSDPKLPSLPLVHLVKLASLARAIVHRFIRKDVKEFHIWSEITSQMIRCPKLDFYFSQKIQNLISTCRSFSGGNGIDYAFPNSANNFPEEQNPIPIGERSLMHEFFLGLFSKNNKLYLEIADIFYFYILVKNRFRMEFIHSNGVTGFKNFYLYQDRKDRFIDNDPLINPHQNTLCRIRIEA